MQKQKKKQYCGSKAREERNGTLLQENQWWNRRKFDIFDFQNNTRARIHSDIREEKVVSNREDTKTTTVAQRTHS